LSSSVMPSVSQRRQSRMLTFMISPPMK
jgi:hypothetical protein